MRVSSWALAVANAAEIETLQVLETAVAERAIMLRADTLEAMLLKLEIWHALGPGAEEPEEMAERASPRHRLVLSIEADLVRLARGRQA